jgi:quercetin dioxygenase-like cupin family protein
MYFKLAVCCSLVLANLASASAQSATPVPGFSCVTLAHRQPVPGAPNVTFKVLRQTYETPASTALHKHKHGEIIYLLSGSGTNTMNGRTSALTQDKALIVPANAVHELRQTGSEPLVVLDVQFTDTKRPSWEPKTYKGPSVCKD